MIIDDEVRTALETLRRHAQGNDFELYRIDVLERDLATPPVAEQIDETHQRFDGVTYHRDKRGHYKKTLAIHQIIWQYYNGEIPTDDVYDVHHRNLNPADNDVSNFQLLPHAKHMRLHGSMVSKSPCEKICPHCGKYFTRKPNLPNQKYCSSYCARKAQAIPRQEKTCPTCGKIFTPPNYRREQVYCSRSCYINAPKPDRTKTCPICGKIFFDPKHPNVLCCSRSCAGKMRRQNNPH